MNRWYWTAEVRYPKHEPFLLSAEEFHVEAEHHEDAIQQLESALSTAWRRISPHDPPKLVGAHRGFLILCTEKRE